MLPRDAALAAVAIVLLAGSAIPAGQQADRGQMQALSRRASERIQALHQEADRLAAEERTLLGELRRLEIDRQIKNEELADVSARAAATAGQLAKTNEDVARLEREDLAARPELSARLVELYKLGHARYLRVLLSVSDVRSVGQAARMVASLAARDRDRIASHQKRLETLKAARTNLQQQAKELATLRGNAERTQVAAERAIASRNALIAKIDAARDLNAQLAGELQAAQVKLQATLRGLGPGAPVPDASLPLRPFQGDLDWPVTGRLRLAFGRTVAGRPPSNGIEIAAEEGAPVRVIHDGTVAFADTFSGFGQLVIVDHGGQVFSLYGNLLDIAVTPNARIAHGALIGRAGPSATASTLPAPSREAAGLYFELRVDGRPVDPLQWLKRK